MSGDYSRNGFDHRLDDLGVLLQQGRPLTDRDWNDLVLQLVRRTQADTLDTIGLAAVPALTPDAFKITATAGTLTIEPGRLYVDGLLVENHGAPPPSGDDSWDPHLAEEYGTEALSYAPQAGYTPQPYYPDPPALPSGTTGKHLVYLDVWQREVTHHMRPGLIESALGVDTTTRLQTVWQVKVLANIGDAATCATPLDTLQGWLPQNAHSEGQLTTDTATVPGQPDPCEVPEAGGYKGRENQFYRVEIHDGGAPGSATFTWSRDNASIGTTVKAIPTLTELVVESIGRDEVLGFSSGDWIEITDDTLELQNKPGLLRRIKPLNGVDAGTRTITLEQPLTSGLFPTDSQHLTNPSRHTRIRRWDQKGQLFDAAGNSVPDPNLANGCITVPAAATTQLLLEHGIVASFAVRSPTGLFRSGDCWVFTARAGEASIELLDRAPPRAIHHHYAPLGIWDAATGKVIDCRTHWPPHCGGCCTFTVEPGESIQEALDKLPPEGGCVCLKTGLHEITAPIVIQSSHVILRGESPGVIVRSATDSVLHIKGSGMALSDIAVEGIRFEAEEAPGSFALAPILEVYLCTRLRVEHCEMISTAGASSGIPVGASFMDVGTVRFSRNRLQNLGFGIMLSDYDEPVEISHSHLSGVAPPVTGVGGAGPGAVYGILVNNGDEGGCCIEHNVITQFQTGVLINERGQATIVADNEIVCPPTLDQTPLPVGADQLRKYLDTRAYAIDTGAKDCVIRANRIQVPTAASGGIRSTAPRTRIADNVITSMIDTPGHVPVPAGISCVAHPKQGSSADHALVSGNILLGPQVGVVLSRLEGAVAVENRIDGWETGWYGVLMDDCRSTLARDNRVSRVFFGVQLSEGERNRVLANRIQQTLLGIGALQEVDLEASGNSIVDCAMGGVAALAVTGATTLLHNSLQYCGYLRGLPFGILVLGQDLLVRPTGSILRVADCQIIDGGLSADGNQVSVSPVLGIFAWVPACQIVDNRIGYTQAEKMTLGQEHRALLLMGPLGFASTRLTGSALVSANHLRGPGRSSLVEFRRFGPADGWNYRFRTVTVNGNVCDHLSAVPSPVAATVQLSGGQLLVNGNHVQANPGVNAMSFDQGLKTVLLGNITTGQYIQLGSVLPMPIPGFNLFV
jgi:hypothetical protein